MITMMKKHKWLNVHTDVVFFLLFFLLGNVVKVKGKHVSHYKHHAVQFYELTKHTVQLKPELVIGEGCVCLKCCIMII